MNTPIWLDTTRRLQLHGKLRRWFNTWDQQIRDAQIKSVMAARSLALWGHMIMLAHPFQKFVQPATNYDSAMCTRRSLLQRPLAHQNECSCHYSEVGTVRVCRLEDRAFINAPLIFFCQLAGRMLLGVPLTPNRVRWTAS